MLEKLGTFALFCSGSNLDILRGKECETDRAKYKMIGAFILLTAVFASLASGYALYVGFKSVWLAALVGLLWGSFIFTLDRFIISTLRKKEIDADLPFREKAYLKSGEILAAVPRLLFAVFVSIVISAPLEMKYFDPEVQRQISKTTREARIEIEQNMKDNAPRRLKLLEDKNSKLETELNKTTQKCDELRERSFGEAEGRSGTLKMGKGPVYREKLQEYEQCKKDLTALQGQTQTEIAQNLEELRPLKQQRDDEEEKMKRMVDESNGFLARLTALHQLSEQPGPVGAINLFITILFILLETTPIVMKLITRRGPYDNLLEAKEHEVYVNQKKAISDKNEWVNDQLEFSARQAEIIRAAEQELTEEVVSNLQDLVENGNGSPQAEVAKNILDRWRQKSLRHRPVITPQPVSGN